MPRRTLVALTLAASVTLSACSAGSTTSNALPTTTPDTTVQQLSSSSWQKAMPSPSTSAQMVCQRVAQNEIASSLGLTATRVTHPTWDRAHHLYSCTYVYPKGNITLSVKEMSSASETTAYFDGIEHADGIVQNLSGLGQGAAILKNNDVVVRKNYKVLLVDVHDIPAAFITLMTRSDVATNIAAVIMGCWSGS
jgi:hypothetical protein